GGRAVEGLRRALRERRGGRSGKRRRLRPVFRISIYGHVRLVETQLREVGGRVDGALLRDAPGASGHHRAAEGEDGAGGGVLRAEAGRGADSAGVRRAGARVEIPKLGGGGGEESGTREGAEPSRRHAQRGG